MIESHFVPVPKNTFPMCRWY